MAKISCSTFGSEIFPNKLIAIGRNYTAHIAEIGGERPPAPLFWFKAPTSLTRPLSTVRIPYLDHRTDFEVELAIIIGKEGKNIPVEAAKKFILGYTTALDITDRSIQKAEGQWARAKSFDTFTPLGPSIETELNPADLRIQLFQNGILRQDARTSMMLFNCEQIVSHVSQGITLKQNDIILTGTPSGIGPIVPGDTLEARIEGLEPLIVHVDKI